MPSKFCLDCGSLGPKELLTRGRCETCATAYEQARGTRQQRGAGGRDYDSFAKYVKAHRMPCRCTGQCGGRVCKVRGFCGYPWGDPNNPITVGHVVPRSLGGGNEWANLRPECAECNYRKGSR